VEFQIKTPRSNSIFVAVARASIKTFSHVHGSERTLTRIHTGLTFCRHFAVNSRGSGERQPLHPPVGVIGDLDRKRSGFRWQRNHRHISRPREPPSRDPQGQAKGGGGDA